MEEMQEEREIGREREKEKDLLSACSTLKEKWWNTHTDSPSVGHREGGEGGTHEKRERGT